jgi:DNA-directed RNA polymerase specialized sigma24 family protein
MLEVPAGTVKSRLHRARDRFIRAARARGLTAENAFARSWEP